MPCCFLLNELLQSRLLHLRYSQRLGIFIRQRHGESNFIAQILAERMDLFNGAE